MAGVDDAVSDYIDGIAQEHRPLFDRLNRMILEAHPEAEVGLSYGIPRYRRGSRRLFVGDWKHGLSIYGWDKGRDGGFCDRHPRLVTGRGTIQLRPADAAAIADGEFRDLFRSALDG